jgi:ATP-dependent helicase STH1/SNF2
MIKGGQLKSY